MRESLRSPRETTDTVSIAKNTKVEAAYAQNRTFLPTSRLFWPKNRVKVTRFAAKLTRFFVTAAIFDTPENYCSALRYNQVWITA
jgi:hypothetical protein